MHRKRFRETKEVLNMGDFSILAFLLFILILRLSTYGRNLQVQGSSKQVHFGKVRSHRREEDGLVRTDLSLALVSPMSGAWGILRNSVMVALNYKIEMWKILIKKKYFVSNPISKENHCWHFLLPFVTINVCWCARVGTEFFSQKTV